MTHLISKSYGEGPFQIRGQAILCGADVTVVFTGGILPHVGAVSLAVYEPFRDSATVSTMTVFSHRDDQLAMQGAKALSTALHCTACVSVGIHLDEATADDIAVLSENYYGCLNKLLQAIKENR